MLNFLISLVLLTYFNQPLSGAVLAVRTNHTFPQRRATESFGPLIKSREAIVIDNQSGKVLFAKKAYQAQPIASLTKLITAMVFLDQQPDLKHWVEIKDDDRLDGGRALLQPGEEFRAGDLLEATLVGSLNNGAKALSAATDLSPHEFVAAMNRKARELGIKQAAFVEPSGLSPDNRLSAYGVALALKAALKYPLIKRALSSEKWTLISRTGRIHIISSTNKLLGGYLDIVGGKTGYIDEAGFCLANLVRSRQVPAGIVVVILGAPNQTARFEENKFLSQWVFDNWRWK